MDNKNKQEEIKEELLRNCNLTSLNYGQLANKLQKRKNIFQVLLPYYSVIGILNTLVPKYFLCISVHKQNILSFWGAFISVTFLVISMQISLARYPERISELTRILNKLKVLKSKINKCSNNEIEDLQKEYNEIISNGVFVGRRYFYKSCKDVDKKCKSNNSQEVQDHFSKSEKFFLSFVDIMEIILCVLVFVLPLIVYLLVLVFLI